MTEPAVKLTRGTAVVVAVGLAVAGAAAGFLASRRSVPAPAEGVQAGAPAVPARTEHPVTLPTPQTLTVTLSPELLARAEISTAPAGRRTVTATLRLPGVVAADAYHQTVVTPLVSGRIETVTVALGAAVRQGQVLARVQSPEVAEVRERVVAAQSMLAAHDRELSRVERLLAIGAASQQELERAHAEHAAQVAGLESAQARLALLGGGEVPAGAIFLVRAPSSGVVTERMANPGQNVEPAMRLFTISDLSSVWVVADVYERDLGGLRIGQTAHVTTGADAGRVRTGRVSYIDPELRPETRTTRVRVELPNPGGDLRFGMFVDVRLDQPGASDVVVVPRTAIQTVGERHVIYVPVTGRPGAFVERAVRLGETGGADVAILDGVSAGEPVVVTGGFLLRSEVERLGLRQRSGGAATEPVRAEAPAGAAAAAPIRTVRVAVTSAGFEPSRVSVQPGTRLRLIFTRMVEETCATDVAFPSLGIRRTLPRGTPVEVLLDPIAGEVAFTCGEQMLKGSVVVEETGAGPR